MYKLVKHRGIHNKEIKENSYDAIYKALNSDKYIGVEFDVRETLDHEFIIYHDAFYKEKLISNINYVELPKYVARLRDILKIRSDKMFLIEIKNITSFDKFIQLLNKNSNKKLYVMSFSNMLIKKINIKAKNYKVGVLNYILNTNNDILDLDFVCILNSLLNERVMNTLKDKEIFSYGLFENKKYEQVYYIVDN